MLIVYVESGLAVIKHMQLCTISVFIQIYAFFVFYMALFVDLWSG